MCRVGLGLLGSVTEVYHLLSLLLLLTIKLTNYGASHRSDSLSKRSTYLSSGIRLAMPRGSTALAIGNAVGLGGRRYVRVSFLVPVLHARITHVRIAPSRVLLMSHVKGHCIHTAHGRLGSILPGGTSFTRLRGLLCTTSGPGNGEILANGRLKVPSLRGKGVRLSGFSSGPFTLAPARLSRGCGRIRLRRLLRVLVSL